MEKFLVRKSKLPDAEQTAPPAKKVNQIAKVMTNSGMPCKKKSLFFGIRSGNTGESGLLQKMETLFVLVSIYSIKLSVNTYYRIIKMKSYQHFIFIKNFVIFENKKYLEKYCNM